MIKNYEIRNKNNVQILYIYLDYNTEFAKINGKKNNKKLKSIIKRYIKDNNIDFKGTMVAIMIGSIMIGTIILNKPTRKDVNINNGNNIIAIIDDYNYGDDLLIDEVKEDNIINEQVDEIKVLENKEDNIDKITVNKKENIVKEEQNEKENIEILEKNIVEDNKKSENEIVEDNKTYVNIYRSNGIIINIELEEYILGVVGAEMPASFNKEALKAQAVVSRTYTLKSLKNGKIITDSSSTQNYKSKDELKIMWGSNFNTYYSKILDAVYSTKGEYLTYNGEYIDAVYHSTSNGYTEDSFNVWGNSFSYLVSVESKYDNTNKNFLVNTFYSYEDISNKLGKVVTSDSSFNIISRNESGRVSSMEIDEEEFTGVNFRMLLGLRSTDFDIEKLDDGVNITTRGYGHGVGMSQYGANGMANNGYSYKDILLHYYKGVSLN